MTWILVVYVYAGAFAKGDSVTLYSIPGWKSEEQCQAAAKQLTPLVAGSTKQLRTVCLEQK